MIRGQKIHLQPIPHYVIHSNPPRLIRILLRSQRILPVTAGCGRTRLRERSVRRTQPAPNATVANGLIRRKERGVQRIHPVRASHKDLVVARGNVRIRTDNPSHEMLVKRKV